MTYLSQLSTNQRVWLAGSLAVAVLIVVVGALAEQRPKRGGRRQFTVEMTIKEIAPGLQVTGKNLARELGLPLDAPKKKRLRGLGVSQRRLNKAAAHLRGHRPTGVKYYVFAALVLFALVFLVRLGRPDGSSVSDRKVWYPRAVHLAILLIAVAVCGFALGKSPNPMEGFVKVFKAMAGLYRSVAIKAAAFSFFIALAVIGNKLICGWACPFGALQELVYSLPLFRRAKRWRPSFLVTNVIRGALFAAMLLLLFGVVGGKPGFLLFHWLNSFNLFNFDFDEWLIPATIVASLLLSLFTYRPFCQLVCPFGFVSWLAERLSLVRVRIDKEKCTECGACVTACPLDAAGGMVRGQSWHADCYSCARCLNVCPQDAIRYAPVFSRKETHRLSSAD